MHRLAILSIVLFSGLQSCKTIPSQDNYNSDKLNWLYITQVEDQLQFKYKSSSICIAGKKEYKSVGIEMDLPLGLIHNSITDNNMTFYYPDRQVIFIKTLYEDDIIYSDSLYYLDKEMAENFIDTSVPTFSEEKKLRDTSFIRSRETLIIKKGHLLIFLYNIKKDKGNKFINFDLKAQEY